MYSMQAMLDEVGATTKGTGASTGAAEFIRCASYSITFSSAMRLTFRSARETAAVLKTPSSSLRRRIPNALLAMFVELFGAVVSFSHGFHYNRAIIYGKSA